MNPESGRRFGPYEIQSRLGGGGMGYVFRAWDARLHREVAIKLLNHEYAMPGMRERFLREARAASALNHPNICTIFDIGEQDGDPYLVMELLKGETLKDRILDRTMQLEEILAVARDTAEALGAAHAKGVVHRDVKPANIFLVEKPNGGLQAKVLDFGLAKIESAASGARGRSLDITTLGATVGTLAYMSPEQARGEALDSRSDLFSLGVVMYEMATRQVPFQGATSALVFVQLLNHAPDPVREWNEAVPRELEKIIFKLLAKERTARYQTARELELALIALSEKGSGGWLRKAVATVPLVRAPDPVARDKRPQRAKLSSDPGLQAPPSTASHPVNAASAAESFSGERARSAAQVFSADQVLRPVARVPHTVAVPQRDRATLPVSSALQRPATRNNASTWTEGEVALPPTLPNVLQQQPAPAYADSQRPADLRTGMSAPSDLLPVQGPSRVSAEPEGTFPSLFTSDEPDRHWELPFEPLWLGLSGIAVIIIACLAFVVLNHSRFNGSLLNAADVIVVTEIENKTSEKLLDQSISEALRFEFAQSPYFAVRSAESYQAAKHLITLAAPNTTSLESPILARKAAERLGAKAYVYGLIDGRPGRYTLHVELRTIHTNDVLATAESHIDSPQQVTSEIDQVARKLRLVAGEPKASVDAYSTPLVSEASANLAALQLYAQAQALIAAREPVAAVTDLQKAVALDPHFVEAHLLLARIYYQLRAETAAASSAKLARASASVASERIRTLAQAAFEIEATGNFPLATVLLRHLTALYPHDPEILVQLAYSLRREGHMAEALQYAQQAYIEDPFLAGAYTQAQSALIGLDRFDSAYQLIAQAQHLNLARRGDALATADLDGRGELANSLVADLPLGRIEYRPDWAFGIYLDNAGRLSAGASLWRSRADAAGRDETLRSASAYLLAQGALDRALLGECSAALALLHPDESTPAMPAGRVAIFNAGLASALCGDSAAATKAVLELRRDYPQSFEVNNYFVADIQGAVYLRVGQPAAALDALSPARSYDLMSVTPYLRGQAHVARHETAIGIVDFQTELAHRGTIYLVGNDVYPAAQIGVARAFAASGDPGNSAEAYRRFLTLWRDADPDSALLAEARAHSGS